MKKKTCPECGGKGYTDNCGLSEKEHKKTNPCEDCDFHETCNVGDFVRCTTCNGTGQIKGNEK